MFINRPEISHKLCNSQEDIKLKCRGCLKEAQNMNFLYTKYKGVMTLAEILETVNILVKQEKGFPDYLCTECTNILVDFTSFKQRFDETNMHLNNVLSVIKQDIIHGDDDINYSSVPKIDDIRDKAIHPKEHIAPAYTEHLNNCIAHELTVRDTSNIKAEIRYNVSDNNFKPNLHFPKHERPVHKRKMEKLLERSISEKFVDKQILKQKDNYVKCKKICSICKDSFSEEEFSFHFETHKTHICKTCGHKFRRKTDLTDHEEIHLDVYKYICQHCGKAFKVRTALNKHRRIHTNPREEVCDVCGQRFNSRDTLKTHYKLKHLKSKDFQCYLCGFAFTLKSTLEKHIERHNPNREKKYICNLCDVAYKNKYNLTRHHLVKHTAFESRPICQFCSKEYTKKIDLVKHLLKHHGQINNK